MLLGRLCHHANSSQLHNLSQLIQNHLHSLSVSINFVFSCCISIANSHKLTFFFLTLYTFSGFHSNFLISFLHLRSYSVYFLFRYAFAFLSAFSYCLCISFSHFLHISSFFFANFLHCCISISTYFCFHFLSMSSFVFFMVIKKTRYKNTEIVFSYREYCLPIRYILYFLAISSDYSSLLIIQSLNSSQFAVGLIIFIHLNAFLILFCLSFTSSLYKSS